MSSKVNPFTTHRQVMDYLAHCYQQGMEMRNHHIWLSNTLGRHYFSPTDPDIKNWIRQEKLSIWLSIREKVHQAVVDQWDDEDQLELEADLKEYLGNDIELAIAAARSAQERAQKLVEQLQEQQLLGDLGWIPVMMGPSGEEERILDGDGDGEDDDTPLLGNQTYDASIWTGLRQRSIGC